MDYKTLYSLLFNRITDAIGMLSRGSCLEARCYLMQAQQDAEELYLSGDDAADTSETPCGRDLPRHSGG